MAHLQSNQSGKNLRLAFFLNLAFTLFEIIGGLWTNSIAILSDALHDLGDSLSLGLSWYLQRKSRQTANQHYTYGYRRFSLLGALINSVVLVVGSVVIIVEAIERLQQPEAPDATGMLIFAIVGVGINGFAALRLRAGKSLNERVVSWHLWEDVLGWLAVLLGAVVMLIWETPWLDPVLSIGITVFILINILKRLRNTADAFTR
ncbi:MAG: cation diffusion facilitator family transporter [Owenweeksia sp.]|nr:cation diffusion facilitator family transporter [Owenweeksia sp.]